MRAVLILCICALVGLAWCQSGGTGNSSDVGADGIVGILPDGACTHLRGVAGRCVQFQDCEHSTDHVDLRLYRPHNYTSVCTSPQICCPLQYVNAPTQASNATQWDIID